MLCLAVPDLYAQPHSLFSKGAGRQTMTERWELDSNTKRGNFIITPYRPVFVTAGRWSNRPNEKPTSENPRYTLPFRVPYNNYEAVFHLSLKTKVVQGAFFGHGDLWVAYTQKAHWQIYNAPLSRPFRELNYEPEVILNFATRFPFLGFTGRMAGIAFTHQSNGRTMPLSRSWNRIIFHVAFERRNWQLYLRPWVRLPDEEDENPAIANYTGRGEAIVVRNIGTHQLSLVARHSLRLGHNNHGSVLGTWVFPILNNLRGQLQVGDGYGETLMDYNHRQTIIGVSVSLVEW